MAQAPLPSKVVTNPRIAKLIELEVAGRIKPEHQQELDTYRAMGLAPKKAAGALTENQSKSSGFYERAAGANTDFEKTQAATSPRGLIAQGLADAFPGTANTLSSSDRQIAQRAKDDFIAASLRYESGAAIGKDEYTRQDQIFFPQPGDSQEVIAQKAQARQRVIDGLKVASGPGAAQVPAGQPTNAEQQTPPAVNPTSGGQAGPTNAVLPSSEDGGPPLSPQQTAISSGETETVTNPALAGLNAHVAGMIKGGATPAEIKGYIAQAGVDPTTVRGIDEAVAFRKANPGYRGGYAVHIDQQEVPLTGARKALATVGASPVGAGVIAAGDAATAGSLPAIVGLTGGNRLQAQAAEDALAAANPASTAIGSIVGGVPAALGGSLALTPKLGVLGAGLASDAAYGGIYGANKDIENPGAGLLKGAATGLVASGVGQGAVGVLGRALSPSGGKLGALYDAGVRPTLGQRFVGTGILGNAVNGVEEALQSVPVAGFAIRGARQKARDQFQRGAFNSALGEIPEDLGTARALPADAELGTQPHAIMQGAFNDAYDKVKGQLGFAQDADYGAAHAAFDASLDNGLLDETEARQVRNIIAKAVDGRVANAGGALAGDTFKAADSDLTTAISKFSDKPRIADALTQYKGIFDDAVRRNSSPDAVAALDAVDRGYAKSAIIEDAARRRGTDTGIFTPTQFDAAVQAGSGGVRSRSYLRGDALFGDYAEAGKSLVDRIPNSGTPERLMATQAALGAPAMGALGFMSPTGAVLTGGAALAYAPVARDVVAGSLAPRAFGSVPRTLGDWIRQRAALQSGGGAALSAPATQYVADAPQ